MKRVKLVDDWRHVLRKAWSVRLISVAAVLSGAEVVMPLLQGVVDVPPGLFAALSGIVTAAALVARLVAQRSMTDAAD